MPHTLTTCTFCGAGCGLYLETENGRITGVSPSASHPTNRGRICVRGWNVHEVASSPDRLRHPMIRRRDRLTEVTWEEAFDFIARRLRQIHAESGPDALAFLNSPRCSNEETYLLQKLARAVFGTNNVDHGTGVYCHNSVDVLRSMLGVPATTGQIADLETSDYLLVDGVDLARQLPTIAGRVLRARLSGARLTVVDIRRHRLAENASWFLQIRPGTEVELYGAMAKVLVDRGLRDLRFIRDHCRNYEAFLDALQGYDLVSTAEHCGVAAGAIEEAALALGQARRPCFLYSTGIENREASGIAALVNLTLLAGQPGRPGAGLFALTEHNNLQGVCDLGMLPDLLPGYRSVHDPSARAELEALWQCRLSGQPGCGAGSVLGDRGNGRVRAVWLCRYDPVSTAFFGDAMRTLDQLDLVIVQHLFLTGTARHADVLLPVTAFGEEEVSFTSTDRRIQLARKVIEPPPGPMPAWEQTLHVARALGAPWTYRDAAAVMEEIGACVPSYSGASHENLQRDFGRPWPCTKDRPLGTPRLFPEGIPPGRPFRFEAIPRPGPSTPPLDHPFRLVFGHSLYYWHQNVLIKHSETLKREYRILLLDYPDGFVEISVDDAQRAGIRDGERVRLHASAGSASAAARVTPEVRAGTIVVPYFVREVEKQIRGTTEPDPTPVYVRLEKEPPA